LIAVVLGASSGTARAVRAAQLLDRGFASNNGLSWLRPSLGTVENLPPIDASPPNLHDEICGGKHHKPASDEDDAAMASTTGTPSASPGGEATSIFLAAGLQPPMPKPSEWLAAPPAPSEPVVVYTGPTRTGAALVAAVAADADSQAKRHGKKSHVASRRLEAEPKASEGKDGKAEAKPAKPSAVRHASARPDTGAKGAERPAAQADQAKPARPKAAAKPKGDAKPAPKSTSG
jgi:D-alanyl-D-alanine carboxypeptidase